MVGIKVEFKKIIAHLGRMVLMPFLYVVYLYHLILTRMHMRIFKKAILRKNKDAEAIYRLFLKKNKDAVPVYFYLGNLYLRSNRKDKALKVFEDVKNTCPS